MYFVLVIVVMFVIFMDILSNFQQMIDLGYDVVIECCKRELLGIFDVDFIFFDEILGIFEGKENLLQYMVDLCLYKMNE